MRILRIHANSGFWPTNVEPKMPENSEPEGVAKTKFVDAKQLLEILFDEACRPSIGWLRAMQNKRAIPFVRRGRLIFFDADLVRASLNSSATMKTRGAL